jgi:hypothetical protein
MKLWVFGHSSSLPFGLSHGISWSEQIATTLGIPCKNFAEAAADNLFIYHCFISNLKHIQAEDIVIVGWSHPNRKSFVLDQNHSSHQTAVNNGCIIFNSQPAFFRSKGNVANNNRQKWCNMIPVNQGNNFFDTWFQNYHNKYECRLNLQAYCDSVQQRVPCRYIPFYFSKESVESVNDHDFYWLDFVLENHVWISESDLHLNQEGHDRMAKIFLEILDNQSK